MRKIVFLISIVISFSFANPYTDGYKLYKEAKKELRKGDLKKSGVLFKKALVIFESDLKSSQALLKAAELYCNGWGTESNKNKAKEYLKKAKGLGVSFVADKCLKNL